MPRLVACLDKFRGTATAVDVVEAVCATARRFGWEADAAPLADGGEGLLDVLGGLPRSTEVTGPLGDPVRAEWRQRGGTGVIEMARASGLELVGGAAGNDPLAATTRGTGELMVAAVTAGCRELIVGLGGSATTDGGRACLDALGNGVRVRGVRITVACDVDTRFVDAAEVFAPQKGATPAQVALLRRRLEALADVYLEAFGVDVRDLPGSGAAGGLAGGLAAIGADLVSGFDVVADAVDLADRMEGADLVVTGEGYLDTQSFEGKVVGGVLAQAAEFGIDALVIAGDGDGAAVELAGGAEVVCLVDRFGRDRAMGDTLGCVEAVVADALGRRRVQS